MKKTARLLSLLLAMLMLVSMVACGKGGDTADATTTAATAGGDVAGDPAATTTEAAQTESPYDEEGYLKHSLPEDLNFNGAEIMVLCWDQDVEKPEFQAEEITGELNNDAIYERNLNVQETLGVTLAWDSIKGQYNNGVGEEYAQYVGNGFNAGDNTWDLMAAHSRTIALTAMYGYCQDLAELPYLDFSKPWWPANMVETATIGESMYFVTGDVSVNSIHQMYVIFYNKDILNQHQLQDPAALVKEGKWTHENLKLLTKDLYQDLDGSNTQNENDLYGFVSLNWHFDALYYGSGLKQCDPDDENLFVISDDYFSEKAVNISEDLGAWCATPDVYINSSHYTNSFANGNALMVMLRHKDIADRVVDAGFSYGIVPIPKYDEVQENHITVIGNPASYYSIYGNSKDADRAAAVLECWAAEAYRTTTPALFETTMKLKYSETSTEAEMYDIIRKGIVFDIGRLFNSKLSAMSDNWDNSVVNNTGWKSASAAYKRVLPKQLEQITDAFKKIQAQ